MTGIRGGIKRGVKFLQLLNAREFAFCAQFEGSLHNEQGIVRKSVFASGNRFFEAQLSEF